MADKKTFEIHRKTVDGWGPQCVGRTSLEQIAADMRTNLANDPKGQYKVIEKTEREVSAEELAAVAQ